MLTFAEELILLALDDTTGKFRHTSNAKFELVLVGAMLMNLALMDRIDTDLENLITIDSSNTGDVLFDRILSLLSASPGIRDTDYWIQRVRLEIPNLRELLIQQLVAKGILKEQDQKFLWVFNLRRYPVLDNTEQKEVKTRIRDIVLSDDIPDPHDIVLISLITSCGLLREVFTKEELKETEKRIYQIAQMDLIGQAVFQSIVQEIVTSAGHLAY